MNNLLNPHYLFSNLPGSPNVRFWQIVIGYALMAIIIAIFASILQHRYAADGLRRRLWYRWSVWGYFVGPVALILAFFRFQNAYFLSMRAWIFGWVVLSIVWAALILWFWFFKLPKKLAARAERDKFERYLPARK